MVLSVFSATYWFIKRHGDHYKRKPCMGMAMTDVTPVIGTVGSDSVSEARFHHAASCSVMRLAILHPSGVSAYRHAVPRTCRNTIVNSTKPTPLIYTASTHACITNISHMQ